MAISRKLKYDPYPAAVYLHIPIADSPLNKLNSRKRIWNMNYKMSFQELAIIQQKILSKQQPTTLEKARKQVETLKK